MKKFLLIAALSATAGLWAQSFNASVRGLVTDTSKAAVPAARVTVTEVSRNLDYTAASDSSGRYVLAALPPGTYTLKAEASGFGKYSQNAFTLQVQQEAT
ncbi:MAG: carboxypeptidase-like regulatory domain-containing protein, partial [Acidobacteriota bacterium]